MKTKEEEQKILERGFLFYFSCQLCKALGWHGKCSNKNECGQRLYKLLNWHFHKGEADGKEEDLYIRLNKPE